MEFDKANVFTALNADEARVGSKGYFSDCLGKLKELVSENSLNSYGELTAVHCDYTFNRFEMDNTLNWLLFYLVKEPGEKELRPYKDVDEMVEDFMKRFNVNVPPYEMPLIWIKTKDADRKYLITRFAFDVTICHNAEVCTPTFEELAEGYTYLDGSPCGIEED